jgi:hypothetical protein
VKMHDDQLAVPAMSRTCRRTLERIEAAIP